MIFGSVIYFSGGAVCVTGTKKAILDNNGGLKFGSLGGGENGELSGN